ncbi:helix-turn-helix domain-containing protein [Hymenobacter rubripertinctus]|uniref:XRE family transcriptional regulator n=1 Tax=Hymenobacter rubripertinctus TaxID=2029981 RepID=A0A418QTS5_9BACT|nr:helix-turn-helix transcriptional regulator [Hymenobacter rubripertinctus]RIY08627.1 XRE family transcriptional regulator [Hymenobacter rubripertinctus]
MAVEITVGQRFTQLISHLGLSKNAFANSLDKTATVIQHLVDERNKPGFDLLCKVFEVYPNVSKDWLLQGEGPMLTDATEDATTPPPVLQSAAQLVEAAAAAAPASMPVATAVAVPVAAPELVAAQVAPAPAAEPVPAAATPAPQPAAPIAAAPAAAAPAAPDLSWQTALYTQQMAHQLAMAEMRNQHLLDQQRMMQQMMDLMQRQLS